MTRIAVLDDYLGVVPSMPCWAQVEKRATIDVFREPPASEDALVERLRGYRIVVPIRERTLFHRALLTRLSDLELLALTGRNSGHVDLTAATERGILVAETDGSGSSAFELTIGLMLAVARRIPQEDRAMRQGGWQTGLGIELSGKTLGILGLGRIGTRVAAFGRLLGMRVLASGPTLTDERASDAGATRVSMDDLFRESDIVSVHLRLSDRTRGVVTSRHLSLMKPTAFLVNTARGPLVDEAALVAVLGERRIAGAALDVYDVEPLPASHPFRSFENLVLSPHMGYVTQEAFEIFFTQTVDNLVQYLNGDVPSRALNPEAMSRRAV
jgi:phosphoglycerate dehydrogenase-like enzyme